MLFTVLFFVGKAAVFFVAGLLVGRANPSLAAATAKAAAAAAAKAKAEVAKVETK